VKELKCGKKKIRLWHELIDPAELEFYLKTSIRQDFVVRRHWRLVLQLRRIVVAMAKAERWIGALPTAICAGAPIPFLNVGSGK
jgi:hypothetical protein